MREFQNRGAKALKSLEDFKDDLVFDYKYTGKSYLAYCDNQNEFYLEDYKGNKCLVNDKSGCCLFPNTYTLGKSLEYASLINDNSSKTAIFEEV